VVEIRIHGDGFGLVVIDDFDFMGVPVFPDETDAPLVIDADAVPARQVALEGFEALSRSSGNTSKARSLQVG
jgi:hypothetical protein